MGASAGLAETERVTDVLGDRQQWHAVRAYLLEMAGEWKAAGEEYTAAAEQAKDRAERDHLVRRSARARAKSGHR
jgi:predicted RNA polymerase sigma factor